MSEFQRNISEQVRLRQKFGDDIFCNPNKTRRYPKVMHNYKLVDRYDGIEFFKCSKCNAEFEDKMGDKKWNYIKSKKKTN